MEIVIAAAVLAGGLVAAALLYGRGGRHARPVASGSTTTTGNPHPAPAPAATAPATDAEAELRERRSELGRSEEQLLARFGHRHRSAFLLCKAVPDALAFVISQDGDLLVFSSDDRHVYCDENLSP